MVYTSNQQIHISHTTAKKETQNTHYGNKFMIKSLPTVETESAVKVVT
jgi:hypothetical protein